MKERINWIDWAKALAVCSVVFCHLPQSQEWFYYRYLQALTMVVFIFISGYLKKDRGSDKENWKKYWYGLIVPYIIYNVVVYPYWILKYYLVHGGMPDMFQAMRPLIGALLMEHESSFAEPLNGPLWYLPAILFMHIPNKYWEFTPQLTPIGIMRNLPYYYMGYLFGQYHLFRECNLRWDIIGCITCLLASILLFSWHLEAFYAGQHILHIALFYPINVLFLFGVLYGCKVLNGLRHSIVTNISIGTLVIIGLHIMLVTIANFSLEHTLGINGTICYQWYTALPTAIVIVALLYPIILWSKRFFPILLGKKKLKICKIQRKAVFLHTK